MCASLMAPTKARTEDLQAAVMQKLKKFGTLAAMPEATRKLVNDGIMELAIRNKMMKSSVSSGLVN
jgi:hypothetical protein